MTLVGQAFDWLLMAAMVWMGWRSLFSPHAFQAVVHFIGLGLLIALAWLRLDAPDLALAEAAIGSGVTGALLVLALARLRSGTTPTGRSNPSGEREARS